MTNDISIPATKFKYVISDILESTNDLATITIPSCEICYDLSRKDVDAIAVITPVNPLKTNEIIDINGRNKFYLCADHLKAMRTIGAILEI